MCNILVSVLGSINIKTSELKSIQDRNQNLKVTYREGYGSILKELSDFVRPFISAAIYSIPNYMSATSRYEHKILYNLTQNYSK